MIASDVGEAAHDLMRELYPICRSITGDGLRATLDRLAQIIPLEQREVRTGTEVLDWRVPKEWNIRDAYVKDADGRRVIDFNESNLHVVGYSVPVSRRMSLDELKGHLHTLPETPQLVPYRTSYYEERWGFCLSYADYVGLEDGEYEVCIDSSLEDGHLTYGECLLKGELPDEVLISCHVCHPSLCNDNLSGVTLAAHLAAQLRRRPLRNSYRFLFAPGTIGAITWLALNEDRASRVKHGLVLTCLGDAGASTYKRSRRGDADIDRAVAHVLEQSGEPYTIEDFSPYGYDERQYCSPGFDLAVGCLMRSGWDRFPQYHTSADDLQLVRPEHLADSFEKMVAVVDVLERNRRYLNLSPKGEPQLGRRGLYTAIGDHERLAMLWVLNLSDREHTLLDIADRARLEFGLVASAADLLAEHGLLREIRI